MFIAFEWLTFRARSCWNESLEFSLHTQVLLWTTRGRERWVRKWSGLTWKIGNLSFVNTLISLTQTCSNKFLIQTCYVTWTEGDGKNTNWIFILSSFIFYVYVKISFFDLLKHENILWITVFDAYSGMITFCIYLCWD